MIKLKKPTPHFILAVALGFIVAFFIEAQGSFFIWSAEIQKLNINAVLLDWIIHLLAISSFICSIIISNTNRFKKINLNKLSIYFLFSIGVSIVTTFILINVVGGVMGELYLEEPIDIFKINLTATMLIGSMVLTFIATFVLLINRKVKYIKFISTEVKNIKNEGFGKVIQVKGKDELAELCTSINDMSMELAKKIENEKRIENTKSELITNISHDLKTPLTSIIGYLELLNNEELDEELKDEYLKIAYSKSLRLKTLVNELFEYTKLTSADMKVDKVKFNISNLINQIVGESILGFAEKGINITLDNPYKELYADIDLKLMMRVFENLIINAEKYSDSNSVFKVSVLEINNKIQISFSNKCSDIRNEELEKIFDKFYRVDKARTGENGGSGLGLTIAKRIVELHCGELNVKKEDDIITFIVVINTVI